MKINNTALRAQRTRARPNRKKNSIRLTIHRERHFARFVAARAQRARGVTKSRVKTIPETDFSRVMDRREPISRYAAVYTVASGRSKSLVRRRPEKETSSGVYRSSARTKTHRNANSRSNATIALCHRCDTRPAVVV